MEVYRETVAGKEQWVFSARQHKCEFKGMSFWPSLRHHKVIIFLAVIPPCASETKYVQGTGQHTQSPLYA
jgi:hypothetical protein